MRANLLKLLMLFRPIICAPASHGSCQKCGARPARSALHIARWHEHPGIRLLPHQLVEQPEIEHMARFEALVVGAYGPACEIEISNRVEHLVPDEFIRESQTIRVEDVFAVDDYGVGEVRSEGVASFNEVGVFGNEAERARGGNLA